MKSPKLVTLRSSFYHLKRQSSLHAAILISSTAFGICYCRRRWIRKLIMIIETNEWHRRALRRPTLQDQAAQRMGLNEVLTKRWYIVYSSHEGRYLILCKANTTKIVPFLWCQRTYCEARRRLVCVGLPFNLMPGRRYSWTWYLHLLVTPVQCCQWTYRPKTS